MCNYTLCVKLHPVCKTTHCSSAAAVPFGRPIWASHMDSVCTASQCWNCADTVVKSRTPLDPLGSRPLQPLDSSLGYFRYSAFDTDDTVLKNQEPLLHDPLGPRPLLPTDSSPGYLILLDTWLWSSCDSLCPCLWLSPSNTDAICLPATAVTTIRNAQPHTCHLPPLSLSLLWFLQDPCLYYHHHDKTYHHDNHHCHRQPVATFTNFLFMMNSNRQDVFVCVKPTCNKNLDLDFAPRITSEHVLVPLFHNHVWLSISLCQPDAKPPSILSFSF